MNINPAVTHDEIKPWLNFAEEVKINSIFKEDIAMPERWLQIKGDPSVRNFLFHQSRVESHFDAELDHIHGIVHALLTFKGAFHVKIHYSSNQLTCWFADDAFRYRVFVMDEVLSPGFLDQFRNCKIDHLQPVIDSENTRAILYEFKRLRITDETIYLRNGSINRVNGMIGMTFSCDGAHYIDHKTFFNKLETFATSDIEQPMVVNT
ncbi:MAG: hypothetical protein GY744_20770 [Gammaproteobacteria bacterium]|nr:hypothetical protein [Gammaproteobacteria bacterium]